MKNLKTYRFRSHFKIFIKIHLGLSLILVGVNCVILIIQPLLQCDQIQLTSLHFLSTELLIFPFLFRSMYPIHPSILSYVRQAGLVL